MNNIEDLNNRSGDLFEFTDTRPTAVTFTYDPPLDKSITVNEGASFDLPIGMEIDEIINYSETNVAVSIDISAVPGCSVDWGTLPSYINSNEDTPEVFQITGLRSGADWNTVMPNVDVTLNSSFNGSLTIPVTVDWVDINGANQSKSYDVNATVLEVLSLTQVTDVHFYTHNTEQVISVVPQIQDTGVGYTWTVTVESLRPEVLDEITYTGSDATFSWNNSTKTGTFTGTKAGVNSALSAMKVKVVQNTFWDFDLEFNSSNDTNAETDVSVVSCKTNDQTVMKKSVSDTYESPNTVMETITGGPRITATDGLFLTEIESYDPNDIDEFNAASATVTGNIVEDSNNLSGYNYTDTNAPTSDPLYRTYVPFTSAGTRKLYPTNRMGVFPAYTNDTGNIYVLSTNIFNCVWELSGSTWAPTAILTHWHELYNESTDSNITSFVKSPVNHMSRNGTTIAVAWNQMDSSGNAYLSKIFIHEKVGGTWTKTHEIDNPHFVVGDAYYTTEHSIDQIYVSSTGNYIIAHTGAGSSSTESKFFVCEYNSGTNSWSVRDDDIVGPTDASDYYGNGLVNTLAISSNGSRILFASGKKVVSPATASENPFIWAGNWNGTTYVETDRILVDTSTAQNISKFGSIDITADASNLVAQRRASAFGPITKYNYSGGIYNLAVTLNYFQQGGAKISADGETIVSSVTSNLQGGATVEFVWNGNDYDSLSNITVHKYDSTNGNTETWKSVTVISSDIAPPPNVITGNDYTYFGGYGFAITNDKIFLFFEPNDDDDCFVKVLTWDDLGRSIDNTGTPTLTIFGNQTDHNTLLWNFEMLVNNGLTTPVELVYTTTQYKTDGTTVASSRNHFVNPV
jgi:hypothetical protein